MPTRRESTMTKRLLLVLAQLLLCQFACAETNSYTMSRTHVVPLSNSDTGGQYELYVKLPENYSTQTDKSYPVIYTTDAAWHMDLLSGTTEFLIPKVILVGISWQKNMPQNIDYGPRRPFASRFRDYSFVAHEKEDLQAKYQFGQADKHLKFIRDTVINHIEENYRVSPSTSVYLGYSMSAEFGAYILLASPNTFDHYILGSPSLDPTSFAYLDTLERNTGAEAGDRSAKVYLSIGEQEAQTMVLTQKFAQVLERREEKGLSLTGLEVITDSDHTTAVPETFMRSIKWLKQLVADEPN